MPKIPNEEDRQKVMPGRAAAMLGVSTKTLSKMPDLHPITLPSGHHRYFLDELEALLRGEAA